MSTPRILFIDAYDSFTNNIISLIETELDATVTTIKIDSNVRDLGIFLEPFDAVIAGPGPGSPDVSQDIGIISQLWSLNEEQTKPVLGICLGFQSLVCAFGGNVERLSRARHGISTQVESRGHVLFDGLYRFRSIQYHSLRASIGQTKNLWQASEACPNLIPLAWDLSSPYDGAILMSVCHKSKPFWGIQFHPESICSSEESRKVIRNWWNLCRQFYQNRGDRSSLVPSEDHLSALPAFHSNVPLSGKSSPVSFSTTSDSEESRSPKTSYTTTREPTPSEEYAYRSMPQGRLDVPQIIDYLGLGQDELVVLDSERRLMPKLGRYSIVGILESTTTKLTYQVNSKTIKVTSREDVVWETLSSTRSLFTYLKQFLTQRKITTGALNLPFWGGLVGYITYEACLETINIQASCHVQRDDICFAFVERSIVIDHVDDILYIQSIKAQDYKWIEDVCSNLSMSSPHVHRSSGSHHVTREQLPVEESYKLKIAESQEQIRAGNSYELCLTNQAKFTTRKSLRDTSWQKYQTLRTLNSAPFGCYLRLGSATILSTSPERFMHWARPSLNDVGGFTSTCQFRPIKGTVQKNHVLPDGSIKEVNLEEASKILSTVKETAENLMIVDLIRHDLHGVVGSGKVRVPSIMQVEEYSTVYQLVSVIEGDLHSVPGDTNSRSGIDVLASSLPPGSMTGAPKKRSCEILKDLEDEPRSIYSGVIGYMCVGGGGDFSVAIRTVFRWDDEDDDTDETWRIGAGGAITILSDLKGEWDEMKGKLESTRQLFE